MLTLRLCATVTCLFCLACLLALEASADYYKYIDNKGVVNITNKLESVPRKYRSRMKVVREEPKKEPAAALPAGEPAAQATADAPEQAPRTEAQAPGKFAELSSRFAWFRPLVYGAALVALFAVVSRLASLLSSPLLSRVIYISFFVGVMVFLYKSYVEHVVRSSMKVKDAAVSVLKKASAREAAEGSDGRRNEHE